MSTDQHRTKKKTHNQGELDRWCNPSRLWFLPPIRSMFGNATPAKPFVSSSFSFQILLIGRFKQESFATIRSFPNEECPEEKLSS